MKKAVIIIGVGELGGVFARAFLKCGHPVYPVTRKVDIHETAKAIPEPAMVLIAVGEKDLSALLPQLPATWHPYIALLQNELLPDQWEVHHIPHPTVISVWFEKKRGTDCKVLLPSPVFGPGASLLSNALETIEIPASVLTTQKELLFNLVLKNVFVMTINIAGLAVGGSVGQLWSHHRIMTRSIAYEMIQLQEGLTRSRFDHEALIAGMRKGFDGDPAHRCRGRSAPSRLNRAIEIADRLELDIPETRKIARQRKAS